MGRFLTLISTVLLAVFAISLYHLLMSSSSGASFNSNVNGVCISKGGRFPPYELQGKAPKSADSEFKDQNMCKVFHKKTCCSASQMHSASLAVENLASYGEASKDCLDMFKQLECSVCHPNVGIQSGPPRICASLCDKVFEACSDAYFSSNASNQVIVPFGADEGDYFTCLKASKWASNGTAFCNAAGFTVQTQEPCYGIKSILDLEKEAALVQLISLMSSLQVSLLLGGMLLKWEQRQARIKRNAIRLGRNNNRRRDFQR